MKTLYSDKQILDRVKSLPSFKGIPKDYWLVAIRSKEDLFDQFDDKIYLYLGEQFVLGTTCTTNPGGPILLGGWKKFTKDGAAIVKSDEIYYNVFAASNGKNIRHHNGKMPCLRQVDNMLYYRDKDNDRFAEEQGKIELANYSTNLHFNSYSVFDKIKNTIRQYIGNWSAGCQVLNDETKYENIIELCRKQPKVTYALLKEF